MTIRYVVEGVTYTANLMPVDFGSTPYLKDSAVIVYVDPHDPAQIATIDLYTTADGWAFLARLVVITGICVLLLVGSVSVLALWKRRMR